MASRCLVSTGTYCAPYQDTHLATPIEPGRESVIFSTLSQAIGYDGSTPQGCDFKAADICSATFFKDKFRLDVYIQPQDGTLSDKDIAPQIWRDVYLHLTYQ